jgi:hypothetical protein
MWFDHLREGSQAARIADSRSGYLSALSGDKTMPANAARLAILVTFTLVVFGGCTKSSGPAQPSQPTAGQSVIEQAQTAEDWQRDYNRLKALGAAYHARIDSTGSAQAVGTS